MQISDEFVGKGKHHSIFLFSDQLLNSLQAPRSQIIKYIIRQAMIAQTMCNYYHCIQPMAILQCYLLFNCKLESDNTIEMINIILTRLKRKTGSHLSLNGCKVAMLSASAWKKYINISYSNKGKDT